MIKENIYRYTNNLKNKNYITYTISEKISCIAGLWGCHLIKYNQKDHITIMRYYHLENVLQLSVSDILRKKMNDTKSHNLIISIILKKHR